MAEAGLGTVLLCRIGALRCALPITRVRETMRPLPVEPVSGTPPYVRGLAIIRGMAVPVLDAALLLGAQATPVARFITMGTGQRTVALAVEEVIGVRTIADDEFQDLPPLLRDAGGETISAIGTLDAGLLVLLRAGRLVPDGLWAGLDAARAAS